MMILYLSYFKLKFEIENVAHYDDLDQSKYQNEQL